MFRFAVAISSAFFMSACMETSDMSEPLPIRADHSRVPDPLIMVGAVTPGTIAANGLISDGLSVVTAFNGRAAGITTFCSGHAHILALQDGHDFTSDERARCMSLQDGWSWSAHSVRYGDGDRIPMYVRFEFVHDLIERRKSS